MQDYYFYIFALVAFVIAFALVKRVTTCLLKSVVIIALIALLAFVYFYFMGQ